jgi:hypothetical protein
MPRVFDSAPAQVDAMLSVWEDRGGSIEDLTLNAFAVLNARADLSVLRVPEFVPADSRLDCSVSGGYRWDPPTLIVTESMSPRRQHFTLLHELGHHLQKTDLSLGATVIEHREPEAFEDACCDAFAARVLLPDNLVDAHVDRRGPDARAAVELFEASNASRAAVSVRLASRFNSPGVVAVLDEAGVVTFAAARGGLFPPARGTNQTANELVLAALTDPDHTRYFSRASAQVWYRDGHSSNHLYGQAAWAGDRLFVVMVEYGASWLPYSPPQEGTATRQTTGWEDCDECGRNFQIRITCHRCRQPKCPAGHCACTVAADRVCDACFLQKHPSQFSAGSATCRDCE